MRKKLLASIFPFLILNGGGALQAQAETMPESMPRSASGVMSLDTVVVTADRTAESLRGVSQSMIVITEEEIKNSPASDVTDLLKQTGIQVNQNGPPAYGQDSISIRGFESSYHGNDINSNILILIDGRRAVGDSLSMQSLNNIARIEIIRGPGSVQYGSSAMGGVINVITKRGGDRHNLRIEAGFGSHGEEKSSAFFSGRQGRFDFALAASYYSADDYKDGDGIKRRNSGLDYKTGYMANLGWNFNDLHRIGLSIQGSRLDDGGDGNDSATATAKYKYKDKDLFSVDLLYEGANEAGDKSWRLRYYQGESSYQIDDKFKNPSRGGRYKNSRSDNDFNGAQAQFSWNLDRFSFTGGVDWLQYDMDQKQYNTSGSGAKTTLNDGDYENIGAFLIAKAYLLEDRSLIITGGLRYDDFQVKMKNKFVDPNRQKTSGDVDKSFDKLLPSIGLAYSPVDFLKLRANYAMAYKVPTPRQLAGGFTMGTVSYHGNTDLDPEESTTWELGFDADWRSLIFSGTYFHTKYKNYMASVQPTWSADRNDREYMNIKNATIDGVELGLKYDLGRQFNLGADIVPYFNWTHLFTYDSDNKKYTEPRAGGGLVHEARHNLKLPGIARDSLGFGLDIAYKPFGLTVSLDGTYYGAREFASYNPTATSGWVQPKSARQGGATVWDMSVVKRLHSFNDDSDLSLKVAAKNIFDKQYDLADEEYMPGSSVYIGLIYNLE